MGYYSTIERNELPRHKKIWKNFKCVLLSTINQFLKVICCMIPNTQRSGKGKTIDIRSVVVRVGGGMEG